MWLIYKSSENIKLLKKIYKIFMYACFRERNEILKAYLCLIRLIYVFSEKGFPTHFLFNAKTFEVMRLREMDAASYETTCTVK